MMAQTANQRSICTGHDGYPPRGPTGWSSDVSIEGALALRVGDGWAVHCKESCHPGVGASGAGTVTVNGQPLMLVGSAISCGSSVATGASTVTCE